MKTEETTTAESSPTVFDTKVSTNGLKAQIKAAGGTAAFYKQNDIIKQRYAIPRESSFTARGSTILVSK
jgi:hypothetical protein